MGFRGKIIAATPLLATIVYLLLGFCADAWHPGWIIFLTIPVVEIFLPNKGITVRHNHRKKAIFVYDDDESNEED